MRAAPTPIRANRIVHTMGKRIPGGERGGFASIELYCAKFPLVSQPEIAPTNSDKRIQKAYVFQVRRFNFITQENYMHKAAIKFRETSSDIEF